jgi:thiosulfate/3-mercaptopyruvate sulfurtransferase
MAASYPPIVDATWLAAHRHEVVVADVRWYLDGRSGRDAYEAGHLPGARFVDLTADLSAPVKGGVAGRHPLPEPDAFAAAMGRLGIGDDTTVVAYDDSGGGTAGRLVWMLRVLGGRAALLDGGLASVTSERETGPTPAAAPASFTARPWPSTALTSADEIAAHIATGGVALDARAADRFRGENEVVDARAGHIPGAASAPWTATLGDDGRFRPASDLRTHFAALGVRAETEVVCYCGSGVSACADILAAEAAGLPRPRLFVASWSGWSADPDRAVATGPTEPSR